MDNIEIAQQIEKLSNTFTDRIGKLEDKIDTMYNRTYVGNGQPALVDRLRKIENLQETCPARLGSTNDSKNLKVSILIGVIALVALITSIIK